MGGYFSSSRFVGANLTDAVLTGYFDDSDFTGATIAGTAFFVTDGTSVLIPSYLTNVTLLHAVGTPLPTGNPQSGVTWSNTVCPDGTINNGGPAAYYSSGILTGGGTGCF